MGWTYYIRIKGETRVHIEGEEVIGIECCNKLTRKSKKRFSILGNFFCSNKNLRKNKLTQ